MNKQRTPRKRRKPKATNGEHKHKTLLKDLLRSAFVVRTQINLLNKRLNSNVVLILAKLKNIEILNTNAKKTNIG